MSIELQPYSLPLRSPFGTAHGPLDDRSGVLLRLSEGDHVGWGDACPVPGWSQHSLEVVHQHLDDAARLLDTEFVADVVRSLDGVPAARAAVAGASADLLARRSGLPLAAHLAADPLDRVPVNATIGVRSADAVADAGRAAVAAGFRTVKLKVGADRPSDDIRRMVALRAAVGDDVTIRLDANGGWNHATALDVLGRAADVGVAFCEEPVAGIDAIAAVGAASPVPVAVDESARTLADLFAAIVTGTIAVVIIKPQALGGPDLAMEAIRLARQHDVTPIVTSMIDSAVGVAHAVHVAAASGAAHAHGLATSGLLAADVAGALTVRDGHIVVPTVPGLGVRPHDGAQ